MFAGVGQSLPVSRTPCHNATRDAFKSLLLSCWHWTPASPWTARLNMLQNRWKTAEKRGPLNKIIRTTFPTLLQIATPLLQQEATEGAEMLKIILKVYHMAMQVGGDTSSHCRGSPDAIQCCSIFCPNHYKMWPL